MAFFYAVKDGYVPGIYTNWADCKKQVDGFKGGAKYKKFPSENEALEFIGVSTSSTKPKNTIENFLSNSKAKTITKTTTITTTTTKTVISKSTLPISKTLRSNTLKRKSVDTNSLIKTDLPTKKKKTKPDLSNYYLCSKDAKKNFYLDPRHANNIFKEETEIPITEPAFKRVKLESGIKLEPYCKKENESPGIKLAQTLMLEYNVDDKHDFTFDGRNVCVYTDGACSGNGKKNFDSLAGIGVFWGPDHKLNVGRKLFGLQTNNRAEITAAIIAISQAIVYKAGELTLYTDSQFMINCMENWVHNWKRNGWQKKGGETVKNVDDMKRLDELCSQIKIIWSYCPGHKGVYGNEEADKLATSSCGKSV